MSTHFNLITSTNETPGHRLSVETEPKDRDSFCPRNTPNRHYLRLKYCVSATHYLSSMIIKDSKTLTTYSIIHLYWSTTIFVSSTRYLLCYISFRPDFYRHFFRIIHQMGRTETGPNKIEKTMGTCHRRPQGKPGTVCISCSLLFWVVLSI